MVGPEVPGKRVIPQKLRTEKVTAVLFLLCLGLFCTGASPAPDFNGVHTVTDQVTLVITPGVAPAIALNATSGDPAPDANLRSRFYYNGRQVDERDTGPGLPPAGWRKNANLAGLAEVSSSALAPSDVPALDWSYGCSATSASMYFGHFDRNGYPDIYTGPTGSGEFPLTNAGWGYGECPLSASHNGIDGRTTNGSVDDYYLAFGSSADPYYGYWSEHAPQDSVGDYMGTNQYQNWQNTDGSTTFYFYTNGAPLYDYSGSEASHRRDGNHGMRLFAESRGYTVTTNYNQYIYGYNGNTQGFTYDQYKSEIDSGYPVLIQLSGHTMLGVGYSGTDTIIVHDTWDHTSHTMTWGGSYWDMAHYGVGVIHLASSTLPVVTGVSPSSGPVNAHREVMITGTHFTGATGVSFGGTAATAFSAVNDTHITATTPLLASGTYDITVTTAGGTSAPCAAGHYNVVAAPVVTGIAPAAGPVGAHTDVTITGTGFTGATGVSFGGTAATAYTVSNATHIAATTPALAAGTYDITVTTAGGTSALSSADQYSVVAAPAVTGIAPARGPSVGGTLVSLTGTGFAGATAVRFGTATATNLTVNADTGITVTAPAHAGGTVYVTVTAPGGTSATPQASRFTYTVNPGVTAISPASGPVAGGTLVTLTGTSFTGATAVRFGTTAATNLTVNPDTGITVTAPAHAGGTVYVTVTTPDGTSATLQASRFSYVIRPGVTAVLPASGPLNGITRVRLTGTSLTGATAVSFGSAAGTALVVNSSTSILVTAPAHAEGPVYVTVTTPGGTSANVSGSRYVYAARPTITAISPSGGPVTGGTWVTVTGTGFTGATAVRFGTTAGTAMTVNSSTKITVTSPAHGAGIADVRVTSPGGTSAIVAADRYTYAA